MLQQHRITSRILLLGLAFGYAVYAQDADGFSWKMGPVDLNAGRIAKLTFANPFCSNPLLKIDVTLAFTDLSGKVLQVSSPGADPAPARKRGIVSCNESIQLEVSGERISPNGTIVGILQVIPDLSGIPWVTVNVPLASLQVGHGAGSTFEPSIVIIPIEPVRRLILP